MVEILLILSIALVIEFTLRELPNAIHPVSWIGKVISLLKRVNTGRSPLAQFTYGVVIALLSIGLFTIPAYFILFYLENLSSAAYVAIGAILLKYTFSINGLRRASLRVKQLLLKGKLDEARFELRSLVSRNTQDLPSPLVISATVESVAENTCDSFVAPLFYFLLFGVPGAIAYRVVNTLDAMIGYHGKYEYLGKFASKLDDVLNFIPARVTALLVVLATALSKKDARASWQTALSDHLKTESPNAGWPMSAVAGALNVQLEKVEHYKLGNANNQLKPETIDAASGLALKAMLSWALICYVTGVFCFVFTT